MCGGGGGGGSGTQQYNWNETLAPYWADALSWGSALKDPTGFGAYKPYPGQRIAPLTNDQNTAFNEIEALNQYAASPIPAMNAASGQTTGTLSGNYLNSNPYSGLNNNANPYSGLGSNSNPYTTSNQYGGFGPTFQSALNSGLQDITNAYRQGTVADMDRQFALAGTYGGSAYQNALANNEAALGKTINNFTSNMVNDQYNRSAQVQGQDLARNSGNYENALNRGSQNYENALGRGSQNFENERNRMMQAVGLGNDQQNLALQRATALTGAGDAQRSINQDYLNQGYQDWQDMNNQQYKMLDFFSGLLGRAQGGVSPSMVTTTSGYQASPFSQLLGAGLLGYGMFGGR